MENNKNFFEKLKNKSISSKRELIRKKWKKMKSLKNGKYNLRRLLPQIPCDDCLIEIKCNKNPLDGSACRRLIHIMRLTIREVIKGAQFHRYSQEIKNKESGG